MSEHEVLKYVYSFEFPDGESKSFEILLKAGDLIRIREDREYPEWAKLESFRCSHCPLPVGSQEYCPVATSLTGMLTEFKDRKSYDTVMVSVESPNRIYKKNASLQSGVSAMLGIYMVSSGCPVMGKLKPMLRFHLPFASLEETQTRVMALYALGQFLVAKQNGKFDWDMKGLAKIYEDVRLLNKNVSQKIANRENYDTNINSLVILDNFADYVTFTIDEKLLNELELLLKEFMIED